MDILMGIVIGLLIGVLVLSVAQLLVLVLVWRSLESPGGGLDVVAGSMAVEVEDSLGLVEADGRRRSRVTM